MRCATAWSPVFEQLEDEAPGELYPGAPGRFELKPWVREAGGGG